MSNPAAIDLIALRARLAHVSATTELDGSIYLHALGCCYLASDNDTATETLALENLFQEQAEIELADGDAVLNSLLLVQVPS